MFLKPFVTLRIHMKVCAIFCIACSVVHNQSFKNLYPIPDNLTFFFFLNEMLFSIPHEKIQILKEACSLEMCGYFIHLVCVNLMSLLQFP